MRFSELCGYFEKLESTPSRLAMTEQLAELFKKVLAEEIVVVVNFSLGQLRPKFDRLEFNLAEKMVIRAIGEAVGKEVQEVTKTYKRLGDIGETVQELKIKSEKRKGTTKNLKSSIQDVYEKLVGIAEDNGQGSQERKVKDLADLFGDLDGVSGKYVGRMVVGKLRLGFSDMTILDALSWMEKGDKSVRKELELAWQISPDIGEIARLAKQFGAKKVTEKVDVELGVPVIPALAQRLKTADEMIEKMGKVAAEPKYDGTRVQIHFRRNENVVAKSQSRKVAKFWKVRTFTRNLDETTHMFPEIQDIGKYLKGVREIILDSEAVGFDPKTGKMRPFQETIQRKRKHGVAEAAKEIPLKFFVFDVLYKEGKSLIGKPYNERRRILETVVKSGKLLVVPEELVTESPEELRKFHAKQLGGGLEGALVKKWDGVYEPGRRGWSWVKFKEAEESKAKLSDTVDGVVMGLYRGRGKRVSFGVGAFLVGIRADKKAKSEERRAKSSGAPGGFVEGKFYTISKVGTGLTDEQWRELKTRSEEFEVKSQPKEYVVDKNLAPDVWLSPGLVVEIAADEVTKSPMHTAGLALRFPRLVRFRDDKGPGQVTSVGEIEGIK